jgi:IS605 OrfB family transposase
LQRRCTKAAWRRLKKLSAKEARLRRHTNRRKEILANAERSRSTIAVEDPTHIRKRVKARRAQRNRLHGWSFGQLLQFVTYKARGIGIPVSCRSAQPWPVLPGVPYYRQGQSKNSSDVLLYFLRLYRRHRFRSRPEHPDGAGCL